MAEKPADWLTRTERFLQQQSEIFGDFSVPGSDPNETDKEPLERTESESLANRSVEPESSTLLPSQRLADCNSLYELREICEGNPDLYTDLEGTNLVFGTGNDKADLMIIGEAPGEEEDKKGEPFVGAAGQLLNKILRAIGFEREDVYIANILKHRPPGNRNPKTKECELSLPYLIRQIELVDPKLILCLGKVSASVLLNNKGSLSSMRERFHPYLGRELMVTYHPAALLRNQQWKRPTWEDVKLLRKRYDELRS